MSTRRRVGERVRLTDGAGMCGESGRLPATIQDQGGAPCFLCDDEDCYEWATLWTDPDPERGGKRHMLCHVSECQMEDHDG